MRNALPENWGAQAQEAADRLVLYHHLHGGVSRVEKFRWLYREYLGREIRPDELEAHCTRFVDHALNGVLAAPLVPGVEDVLKAWQDRLPLVVCSARRRQNWSRSSPRRGLDVYFSALYGLTPRQSGDPAAGRHSGRGQPRTDPHDRGQLDGF